ncbi:hypothetical protein HUU59_05855 [bacterium]|nr:hypothetical protein [bacterium]
MKTIVLLKVGFALVTVAPMTIKVVEPRGMNPETDVRNKTQTSFILITIESTAEANGILVDVTELLGTVLHTAIARPQLYARPT